MTHDFHHHHRTLRAARYLHPAILDYSKRLTDTMPEPLKVRLETDIDDGNSLDYSDK